MSDGSNTSGRRPQEAARAATAAGVPVSTIAYGTADGSVTINGQTLRVPADTESLRTLADSTGGQAYEAASGEELGQVYEDIGSSIGTRTERQEVSRVRRDRTNAAVAGGASPVSPRAVVGATVLIGATALCEAISFLAGPW